MKEINEEKNELIQPSNKKGRLWEIIGVFKNHNVFKDFTPVKFRLILEDLGPTFVKFGQILSNRPDMIPQEYIAELSKLRNDVKPMEYEEVLDILREELNRKEYPIFLSIDREPLGSASIAQAHKAVLKDGTEVVVKVQRRNIVDQMMTDIELMKKACRIIHMDNIFKNVFAFEEVLDEIKNTTIEEMNFLMEADHISEFYETNKQFDFIRIPRIIRDLTTEKVLVMEYLDGCNIFERDTITAQNLDMDKIGRKLAEHFIYQALDVGYFHADPHPNNLLITDGKIGYIDFGMMGRLSNKNKDLLKNAMIAITNNDIREVVRVATTLCGTPDDIDCEKLGKELDSLISGSVSSGICDINVTEFVTEFLRILVSNRLRVPKDITMLARGSIVLEGTLSIVSPTINLMEVFQNRVKDIYIKDYLTPDNLKKEAGFVIGTLENLKKIPNDLHSFFDDIGRGNTKFKFELTESNKFLDRFEKMVHRVVVCILDVAFIVSTALMASNELKTPEQEKLLYVFVGVSTFLTLWLFLKMYLDKLNRKKNK